MENKYPEGSKCIFKGGNYVSTSAIATYIVNYEGLTIQEAEEKSKELVDRYISFGMMSNIIESNGAIWVKLEVDLEQIIALDDASSAYLIRKKWDLTDRNFIGKSLKKTFKGLRITDGTKEGIMLSGGDLYTNRTEACFKGVDYIAEIEGNKIIRIAELIGNSINLSKIKENWGAKTSATVYLTTGRKVELPIPIELDNIGKNKKKAQQEVLFEGEARNNLIKELKKMYHIK